MLMVVATGVYRNPVLDCDLLVTWLWSVSTHPHSVIWKATNACCPLSPSHLGCGCAVCIQAVYEQLFDLIVARINVALDPAIAAAESGGGGQSSVEDFDVDVLSIGKGDLGSGSCLWCEWCEILSGCQRSALL